MQSGWPYTLKVPAKQTDEAVALQEYPAGQEIQASIPSSG